MNTVLFIDDQLDSWLDILMIQLKKWGLKVVGEENPMKALSRIKGVSPDIVLLDILFPENGKMINLGLPTIKKIKKKYPTLPVVILTSTLADSSLNINPEEFNDADYLFAKDRLRRSDENDDPFKELGSLLILAIEKAHDSRTLDERLGFIVGQTEKMKDVAEKIVNVAKTNSTILLTGESGTGKELAVQTIKKLGDRKDKPLIIINCGGLTGETLESRLFGHTKGAFTGANRETRGFFEEAHTGTLFLDEVETMSLRFQEMLLRVLQDKKIIKMGASREQSVDVRIIAATNQNLLDRVKKGTFRQDLYERLSVLKINLPPLRERRRDIPVFFSHFVFKKNEELGLRILPILRDDVAERLKNHDWPGNIREFENVIHAAMVKTKANILTPGAFELSTEEESNRNIPASDLIVEDIIKQRCNWDFLKEIQGDMRHSIFVKLIERIKEETGKKPSHSYLAKMLKMKEGNLRRVMSKAKVFLTKF